MKNLTQKLQSLNWYMVSRNMHNKGYAEIPDILDKSQCEELIAGYDKTELYRKSICMERYRFGLGEYKYFKYPLPDLIQTVRENIYLHLAIIANYWMDVLSIKKKFPPRLEELLELCHAHGQTHPTALILQYGTGGFNTLHQDLYGEVYFPMQAALFLNDPDTEYQGGEFVLVQQIPRAQSKAMVVRPKKGSMILFTTNFMPVPGKRGYYRAKMKHGVSEVLWGERHTLGIIFHDALT